MRTPVSASVVPTLTRVLCLVLCLGVAACGGSRDRDGGGSTTIPPSVADSDNDGVADAVDNCPTVTNPLQEDADADSIGDACDPLDDRDSDGDGVPDVLDNCPSVANPDQADSNANGTGDACETSTGGPVSGLDSDDATALYRHFNQYANPSE